MSLSSADMPRFAIRAKFCKFPAKQGRVSGVVIGVMAVLALLGGGLGGCTTVENFATQARDYTFDKDSNLRASNYAAADYLASMTKIGLDKDIVLVPEPLMHENGSGMTSPFGEVVSAQVAERFAQLGYNVPRVQADNPARPPRAGSDARTMDPSAGIAIGGTYDPHWNYADIKLRLIERKTGRIINGFDYRVAITKSTSAVIEDKPTVYRVP